MNKVLVAGLAVVGVAAAGAFVGAPSYLGGKIENLTREQLAAENLKPFSAEFVKYDRSSRSSDVEIKLSLDPACLGDNAEAAKDAYLVYRAQLNHGPFAGGLNAATYSGTLSLSPTLQEGFTKLTGQPNLMTFSGTYGLSGASDSTLTMPAFDIKDPEHQDFSGRFNGLNITLNSDASGKQISYTGKSDGFSFDSEDGSGKIGAIEFSGKQHAVIPSVWAGDVNGGVKEIAIKGEGDETVRFEDLSFTSSTSAGSDNLLTASNKFVAAKLSLPAPRQQQFTNATYDISVKNLPAEALRSLNAKSTCAQLQDMAALLAGGDKAERSDLAKLSKLFDALLPDLKVIVAANPVIAINRIGVDTPDGPVDFNANITVAGVTDADWAAPMQLLQRIKLDGKLTLPQTLLPEDAAPMIEVLSGQGYLSVQDKQLSATLKLEGGNALINDKPAQGLAGAFLGAR